MSSLEISHEEKIKIAKERHEKTIRDNQPQTLNSEYIPGMGIAMWDDGYASQNVLICKSLIDTVLNAASWLEAAMLYNPINIFKTSFIPGMGVKVSSTDPYKDWHTEIMYFMVGGVVDDTALCDEAMWYPDPPTE